MSLSNVKRNAWYTWRIGVISAETAEEGGVMYFEEDPFDRCCRLLVAYMVLMVRMTELVVWDFIQHLKIQGSYWLAIAWLRMRRVGKIIYYRSISPLLMECGLKKVPTWAEIEAYRLQLVAKSGYDIPRPAALEEGLRQEQMRQES